MKIISKIVVWILSLIIIFIVSNLIIGCVQYKGINNYIQVLDNKDWSYTVAQVNINNPVSIFSIFYEEGDINLKNSDNLIQTGDIVQVGDDIDIADVISGTIEDNDIDPYDPEFEDEFNSFFGRENVDINQKTEDLIQDDTVVENNDENTEHSIATELIQKFNE